MRILLTAPLWYPLKPDKGGVEQVVFLLGQGLLAQGHEVKLIASGDSAPMGRLLPICPDSIIAAMERGDAYEYWCYEAAAIVETLRRASDVDIVHSHLHAALFPFSHLASVPVVHTLHNYITPDVVWLARRFPGNLVTVGQHQASVFEGVDRVRSIHNRIDIEAFPFCSQPDDYLLFLGRLIPNKGADIAIQTARALCQPLIIAGPTNNDHRAYFEEKILKAVDDRLIRYVGPVGGTQKLELLRKAKGLLFPVQWDEPFGLVMVESMACGTPVVALRKGAVPEIINPGVNSFYADRPEDLPILARRLTELDRLEVRRSVEAKFSYHRMVADYLALYREILDRRSEVQAT